MLESLRWWLVVKLVSIVILLILRRIWSLRREWDRLMPSAQHPLVVVAAGPAPGGRAGQVGLLFTAAPERSHRRRRRAHPRLCPRLQERSPVAMCNA